MRAYQLIYMHVHQKYPSYTANLIINFLTTFFIKLYDVEYYSKTWLQ